MVTHIEHTASVSLAWVLGLGVIAMSVAAPAPAAADSLPGAGDVHQTHRADFPALLCQLSQAGVHCADVASHL